MYFANSSSATALAIKDCFDETAMDNREFPLLHRLVLGLEKHSDLATQLAISTAEINARDAKGRTALAWAAYIGDAQSARKLIECGADPNILEVQGYSALHLVSLAPNPACLEPLIKAGAALDSRKWFGETALNRICGSGSHDDDISWIEPLIKAGADMELANTHQRRRPLHQAVLSDRVNMARFLIEAGADIECRDRFGNTPLLCGILYNCHDCLRLLLSCNADRGAVDETGQTVLHLAALTGDVETLTILADDVRMVSEVSSQALDHAGKLFEEAFSEHAALTEPQDLPGLRLAFEQFLRCVSEGRVISEIDDVQASDSEAGDEAFFSADEG